jgi:hypothetical protein
MKRTSIFLAIFTFCLVLQAQNKIQETNNLLYHTENWILNPTPNQHSKNTWTIEKDPSENNQKKLFLSSTQTYAIEFDTSVEDYSTAIYPLDIDGGDYCLSIDALIYGFHEYANLQIAIIPYSENSSSSASRRLSRETIAKHALTFPTGLKYLCDQNQEQHFEWSFPKEQGNYLIVFMWQNRKIQLSKPLSGYIKNIVFSPKIVNKPSNLNALYSPHNTTFTWDTYAQSVDIIITNKADNKTYSYSQHKPHHLTIKELPKGLYDIKIKCYYNNQQSIWYHYDNIAVFQKIRLDCFDLSKAKCQIGTVTTSGHSNKLILKNLQNRRIDLGNTNPYSHHTINYDKTQKDYYTNNKLSVIPQNSIASIRLGNPMGGADYDAITYKYTVDSEAASILLLNYAIVMENPNHPRIQQPHFTISILDAKGEKIDSQCLNVEYYAPTYFTNDWHTSTVKGKHIVWKNWNTMGLHLQKYNHQTIYIQIATNDCTERKHFSYAYFNLQESWGHIEGMTCNSIAANEFIAPPGFQYRWYTHSKPTFTISQNRTINIQANDTNTYHVDLIYNHSKECYFTLSACGIPRSVHADFEYEVIQKECTNYLVVHNKSYAQYSSHSALKKKTEVDNCYWDFGIGKTSNDLHPDTLIFPSYGGTFIIQQIASLNHDLCQDTCRKTVTIPRLHYPSRELNMKQCAGDVLEIYGHKLTHAGSYSFYIPNPVTGCDSVIRIKLDTFQTYKVEKEVILLADNNTQIDETIYNKVGNYSIEHAYQTQNGCDSIVTTHIIVKDNYYIDIPDTISVCADEEAIQMHILSNFSPIDTVNILFSTPNGIKVFRNIQTQDTNIEIPITNKIKVGNYPFTIELKNHKSHKYSKKCILKVLFPSSIISQRWNDVLALKNEKYNGGYQFKDYQWFENGYPIINASHSILYEPQGLNSKSWYQARVKCQFDNQYHFTCPFQIKEYQKAVIFPTQIKAGTEIQCNSKYIRAAFYTPTGLLYSVQKGNQSGIKVPSNKGIYIFVIYYSNGNKTVLKITTF